MDALSDVGAADNTGYATVTNAVGGAVTVPADTGTTGFTLAVTTTGVGGALSGDLTGNLTGNVTGDLTGDVLTVAEIFTVTPVADVAGSLNDTYFTFSSRSVNYYVWMNVNSAGTDPAIGGKTGVEIAVATAASIATIATAIQVALDAISGITAADNTGSVTVTLGVGGDVTAPVDTGTTGFALVVDTAGDGGAIAGNLTGNVTGDVAGDVVGDLTGDVTPVAEIFTVTPVADVAGSLNDTYFLFSSRRIAYYVWMNVNSAGTDPTVADKVGVEIALATGASIATVATAIYTALDALTDVGAADDTGSLTVTLPEAGATTAPADSGVPTGFAFVVTTAGVAGSVISDVIGCPDVPSYTVAELVGFDPTAAANVGRVVHCSDGDAGAECLAYCNGTSWLRSALGAAVAIS